MGHNFIALIGIAIVLIKLLARWDSNAVEGYVKEAPLASMTRLKRLALSSDKRDDLLVHGGRLAEVKAKGSLSKWKTKVRSLAKEVRHLKALRLEGFDQHEDLKADLVDDDKLGHTSTKDLTALVNKENAKVHVRAGASGGALRTRCGWSASPGQVDLAPATEHARGNRCTRCWRRVFHLGIVYSSASESSRGPARGTVPSGCHPLPRR